MTTGVEPAVTARPPSRSVSPWRRSSPTNLTLSAMQVRTVQHRRPASTMSLQDRIAELHETRERHAGDPLIIDACDAAIKALGSGMK